MRLKKHRGSRVKESGTFLKEEDYNGDYALEIQTENDEAFSFVLEEDDIQRLNKLTTEPYGKTDVKKSYLDRIIGILPWK